MYRLKIAVIIPAYNAARTVGEVIAGVPGWIDAIYVVDDASTDGTERAVLACKDARVRFIRHGSNAGVGGAMTSGYRRALADGMDVMVKMDADGQMNPEYLFDLVEPILDGRADYTKGNRFVDAEGLAQMPWVRRVGNAGLSFLTKCASGYWQVFDPANGYTAVHRAALGGKLISGLHQRFFFESSMLCMLKRRGAVVEDVAIPARYGDRGSHLSVTKALFEFPFLLLRHGVGRILWQYFTVDFNAVSVFLVTGLMCALFGTGFGMYHWVRHWMANTLTPTGTIMISVIFVIVGFQLLLEAAVLDIGAIERTPIQKRVARKEHAQLLIKGGG